MNPDTARPVVLALGLAALLAVPRVGLAQEERSSDIEFLSSEIASQVAYMKEIPGPAGNQALDRSTREEYFLLAAYDRAARRLREVEFARPLTDEERARMAERIRAVPVPDSADLEAALDELVEGGVAEVRTMLLPHVTEEPGFDFGDGETWADFGDADPAPRRRAKEDPSREPTRIAEPAAAPTGDHRNQVVEMDRLGMLHFRFGLPIERLFGVPSGETDADRDAVLAALGDVPAGALEEIPFMGPTVGRFPLDFSGDQVPVRMYTLGDELHGQMGLFLWTHDLGDSKALRVGRYPTGVVTAIELFPLGELRDHITTERAARQWLRDLLARQDGAGPFAPRLPEGDETAAADDEESSGGGLFGL